MNHDTDRCLAELATRWNLPALQLADGESLRLDDGQGPALSLDRDDHRGLLHLRAMLGELDAATATRLLRPMLQANHDRRASIDGAWAWDAQAGHAVLSLSLVADALEVDALASCIDHFATAARRAADQLQAWRGAA